jgi:hypothetical protein
MILKVRCAYGNTCIFIEISSFSNINLLLLHGDIFNW